MLISALDTGIANEYQFYIFIGIVGSPDSRNKIVTDLKTLRYGCGTWLILNEDTTFTTAASFFVLDIKPVNEYIIQGLTLSQPFCPITEYKIVDTSP